MRVLVTGGRDYDDAELVFRTLDQIHAATPITLIIEGACPTGADAHARAWAALRKIRNDSYEADWTRLHRSAGPIRNARMLAAGKPDLVVSFAGHDGTKDMTDKAIRARVHVMVVLPTGTTVHYGMPPRPTAAAAD